MIITLPYRERAALAMVDSALRADDLQGTLEAQSAKTWIRQGGALSRARSLGNASSTRVGIFADMLRILMNQFKSPVLSLAGMHYSKVLYDLSASRKLGSDFRSVVAFPGAARSIFSKAPSGTVKVLHCVDAHPRSHNSALLEHFSKKACRAELYPNWLVDRIESEIELADILLVPSNLVRKQMMTHGVPPRKLVLEPYGVDFELFSPVTRSSAETLSSRPRPKILYVGQISRRKGIGFLLEAAAGLEIDVELVGNVFDPTLVRSLPPNVQICPPLSHDQLVTKYQTADAFVIPTVEDACSLVALEASAAGLPVISTPMNGALEILPAQLIAVSEAGDVHALRNLLLAVGVLSAEERRANRDVAKQGVLRSWDQYGNAVRRRIDRETY